MAFSGTDHVLSSACRAASSGVREGVGEGKVSILSALLITLLAVQVQFELPSKRH